MRLAVVSIVWAAAGLAFLAGCESASTRTERSTSSSTPASGRSASTDANAAKASPGRDAGTKSRTFTFTYEATVTGLAPMQAANIWAPVPTSDVHQQIEQLSESLPGRRQVRREGKWHNAILFLHALADADGKVPLRIAYRVTRREACEIPATEQDQELNDACLGPDALAPIGGKPLELLAGKTLPGDSFALARMLYDVVDDHMIYRKDKPGWGRGDAVWACESGFGNCTDFHSLFISLARTEHLPARFEIGFGLPIARGEGTVAGYHCWAWARTERGWIPVDISEASKHPEQRDYFFGHLCENRVMFSAGRDLALDPPQSGPPLNFFVYPYVEVNGRPWPAAKIQKRFTYADVATGENKAKG